MEEKKRPMQTQEEAAKSHVWDCDSCLYDSFELQSFKRQVHSAIVSRSLSMPRLQETSRPAPLPTSTTSSKISRTFQKMLRSVFPAKWKPEKQSDGITAREWEEKSVEVLVQEFDSMLLGQVHPKGSPALVLLVCLHLQLHLAHDHHRSFSDSHFEWKW